MGNVDMGKISKTLPIMVCQYMGKYSTYGPGGASAPADNFGPGPGGAMASGFFFCGFAGAMAGPAQGPGRP